VADGVISFFLLAFLLMILNLFVHFVQVEAKNLCYQTVFTNLLQDTML